MMMTTLLLGHKPHGRKPVTQAQQEAAPAGNAAHTHRYYLPPGGVFKNFRLYPAGVAQWIERCL